ncbi:UNVERIFIED_CONTAM: hypothetical protein K2H54_040621 [Gekko kuhli]
MTVSKISMNDEVQHEVTVSEDSKNVDEATTCIWSYFQIVFITYITIFQAEPVLKTNAPDIVHMVDVDYESYHVMHVTVEDTYSLYLLMVSWRENVLQSKLGEEPPHSHLQTVLELLEEEIDGPCYPVVNPSELPQPTK